MVFLDVFKRIMGSLDSTFIRVSNGFQVGFGSYVFHMSLIDSGCQDKDIMDVFKSR